MYKKNLIFLYNFLQPFKDLFNQNIYAWKGVI